MSPVGDSTHPLDSEEEDDLLSVGMEPLLTFVVAETTFGIPANSVEEIVSIGPLTDIPLAPSYLTGLMSWRGRPVPLLSIEDFVGLSGASAGTPADELDERPKRVIIAAAEDMRVAVCCDGVNGVVEIPVADIEKPRATESQPIAKYLRGEVDREGSLLLCLDLSKLFGAARLRE